MKNAYCLFKNKTRRMVSIDEIKKGQINETNILTACCPYCGSKAFIRHNNFKEWCFYGVHKESCTISTVEENEKLKITRVKDDVIIDLASMINHIDKDPITRNENLTDDFSDDEELLNSDETLDFDFEFSGEIEHHYVQKISSVSNLYNYYLTNGKDDAQFGSHLRGADLVVNKKRMVTARVYGLDEDLKIIPLKKAVRKNLKHGDSIVVPRDYVLLQDAYSTDYEKSIYVLLRIKNDKCNKQFQDKLFDKTASPNKKKINTLIVAAYFKRIKNEHYQIYLAEVNTKCVAFKKVSNE